MMAAVAQMDAPLRVAQLMTDMNYGGVEAVVMNYYRHIDRTRVQFDFFAFEGSSLPQRAEIESLGGRIFLLPRLSHLPAYESALQRGLAGYHICHCHMNTLGVFGLRAAQKAGVPVRILHNHSTAGRGETKKNLAKYLLRPFAGIYPTHRCACSRYAGQWLYGKRKDFRVVPNAIDLEKFCFDPVTRASLRRELGIEDRKVIGHVGRFCYQKNHDFLIDIFSQVLKAEPSAVLLLLGEGELLPSVRDKVSHLGLQDRVLFLGARPDAWRWYQAMDLFLLPSRYEGLPVVGVEAQASGLPCVFSSAVTREAGILDTTVFVQGGPVEYADAVLAGLSCPRRDTREDLRAAGFDITAEAEKLLNFYEELADEDHSA